MKTFIQKILKFLGLMTCKCHTDHIAQLEEQIHRLEESLKLKQQLIDDVTFKTMQTYMDDHKRDAQALVNMNDKLSEATAFYKEVQKKLSKGLTSMPMFTFPDQPASFSNVTTEYVTNHTVITGKFIMDDTYTQKIHAAAGLSDKKDVVIKFMKDYYIQDKIMRDMINSGALEMVLGYNDDATCAEVFFRIAANNENIFKEIKK